jgi:hypothetical protein
MSKNRSILDVIISGRPIYIKEDWSLSLCINEGFRYELKVNDITVSEAHDLLSELVTLKDLSARDRSRVGLHVILKYKIKWELSSEIKGRIEQEEIEDRKAHPERWVYLDGNWRRINTIKVD